MNRFLYQGPGRLAWRLSGRMRGSAALARLRSHPRITLLTLTLAALAAALVLGASTGRPSSGNCFAGALSEDPIHCQVLTSAYDEGVLDIKAMYEGANLLYIFIANPEPEWQAINDYIFTKAKQAVAENPVPYCYEDGSDWCNGGTLQFLFANSGRGALLPGSDAYSGLRMIPGGEDALTEQDGWASFERLWPRADAIFTGAGEDDGTFDLSDVDLVVDGEPDCYATSHSGCGWYEFNPDLKIVGDWGSSTTKYYQVKVEPGREDEQLAYVEADFKRRDSYRLPGNNPPKRVLIPVKYSYLELWRWATLLDRFAESKSNGIGIKSSGVAYNVPVAIHESYVLPAAGLTLIEDIDRPRNWSRIRSTVGIASFDPQKTIAALPQLLSQLGIPADAVGIVRDGNELPLGPIVPH